MESMISNYKQKIQHLQKLEIRLKWRTQRLHSKSKLQSLFEYNTWEEQQSWLSTLPTVGRLCPEMENEDDWIANFMIANNHSDHIGNTFERSQSEDTLVIDKEEELLDDRVNLTIEKVDLNENLKVVVLESDTELQKSENVEDRPRLLESPILSESSFDNSEKISHESERDGDSNLSLTWLLNPESNDLASNIKPDDDCSLSEMESIKFFSNNLSCMIQLEAEVASRCTLQFIIRDKSNDLSPNDLRWHLKLFNCAFLSIESPCHANLSDILFWRGLNIGTLSKSVLVAKIFNSLLAFDLLEPEYLSFIDSGYRSENPSGNSF